MVADALSRKACSLNAIIQRRQPAMFEELEQFSLELVTPGFLDHLEVKPTLLDEVKKA